jgi:hypothetical protein
MITLTEYAFAKLRWFRLNCNENVVCDYKAQVPTFLEVSLMGVSASEEDLAHIVDFRCVPQDVTAGLTEPTDEGMAAYFEGMVMDEDISAMRCGRFWAHTHPGTSPTPSSTDNETFSKWFKESDYGVMYILADGDDSCRVKHGTKYFGVQTEEMPVYVVFNKTDNNNQNIWLSTKALFTIDKQGKSEGYTKFNIADCMTDDYSAYHEAWLEELKRNVKKKSYGGYKPTTTTVTTSHIPTTTTQPATADNKDSSSGIQTSTRVQHAQLNPARLVKILILNEKDNINQFSRQGIMEMCKHYDVTLHAMSQCYKAIKTSESSFDAAKLMNYESWLIGSDGQSILHLLPKEQLITICTDLVIRPKFLEETLKFYIEAAHAVKFQT